MKLSELQRDRLRTELSERGAVAPEEYETRPKDSAISSDGAKCLKAEPNPPTSCTHKQAPTESSVERTYSFNPSRGDDFGTPPSETGKSRGKVGQSSDSVPPLSIKETYSTHPPLASNQSQPKFDIGVPPKLNRLYFSSSRVYSKSTQA